MLDTPILDIIIGILFILFLYSLLATSLLELFAGLFNYRPSMLQRGIQQMLDGQNYYYFWWERLANLLMYYRYRLVAWGRKNTTQNYQIGFMSNFLFTNSEDLVGISENVLSRKEYLSSEFTLHKILFNNNTNENSFRSLGRINRGTLDKTANLFSSMIMNHPIYKSTAGNTIISTNPSYISPANFSDIIVDILGKRMNTNPSDGPILMKDIKRNIRNISNSTNLELRDVLNIYVDQANGDVLRFKWLIELWYEDQMNRISGWYKRQTSYLLFAIGFVLAISLNVDIFEIAIKLENNPNLARQLGDGATEYIGTFRSVDFDATKASKKLDTLYHRNLSKNASLLGIGWGTYGHPIDSLQLSRNLHIEEQRKINRSYSYTDSIYQAFLDRTPASKRLLCQEVEKNRNEATYKHCKYLIVTNLRISETEKLLKIPLTSKLYFIANSINVYKFFSFFITAIGISFGAQFWFDLLIKFVNIRAAGKKPDETPNPIQSKNKKFNLHPDTDSFG